MGAVKRNPAAFKPGCAPGPGRPKGMRNRLTEIALQALGDDFKKHGIAVIEKVRRERPHTYLSIIASLLPRQLHVEHASPFNDLTDSELDQLEQLLAAMRAKAVQQLDQHNGTAIELEPSGEQQDS